MNRNIVTLLAISLLSLRLMGTADGAEVLSLGFVKGEFFTGITGTDVSALTSDAKYTGNKPDEVRFFPGIDSPNGYADNYGVRVTGLIIPSESADYDFFLRSDDASSLFLSADQTPPDPLTATPIAHEDDCCDAFLEPGTDDATTASPISLVAGKQYAFVVLMKEGGGGDYVQVAMRKVGDTTPAASLRPIGGKNVGVLADSSGATLNFTTQPVNTTQQELLSAEFTVAAVSSSPVYGTPPVFYQWQKNGVDIPGASDATYVTPTLQLSDSGTKYRALAFTLGATATSDEVTLTVSSDVFPPKVVSVGTLKNANNNSSEVGVIFDEALQAAAATTVSNYSLNTGAITAARYVTNSSGLNSPQSGVVLTATGITPGNSYTLTVKGQSDVNGNAMTAPVNVQFIASPFNWISIGRTTELIPPSDPEAFATGTNGFNLVSGGNAFWTTVDDITMVYEEITGDFDKVAQVEYTDPASHWARSGLSARESLNNGAPTTDDAGANPASRYQMIISDPAVQTDSPGNAGTAGNNTYELNRRLITGGATTGNGGNGTPPYPNSFVRIKRVGQLIEMYRSYDGLHWVPLANTDFADVTINPDLIPLPDKMFVGPTYGPENGNLGDDTTGLPFRRSEWVTRIRNYGDLVKKPRGTQTYSIGLNFGAADPGDPPVEPPPQNGAALSPLDVAGVDTVAQAYWNNLFAANTTTSGTVTNILADNQGASEATTVTIDFESAGTWESTGRGEENNRFTGADSTLMTGYLDTGAATTTHATISNIPTKLTSGGYDVYVYLLGGVGVTSDPRGGGYRIVDSGGTVLKDYVKAQAPTNPTNFVQVPSNLGTNYGVGTYIVFSGLKATNITVEASTENGLASGATPRAPMNAIQLVVAGAVVAKPTLSVARTATGITLTYTGTLQSADKVDGPYTDVTGATSPHSVLFSTGAAKFYRARQ